MTSSLEWPNESAIESEGHSRWQHPGSNICLDFHGDPVKARLVIFSDGNHHMALQETTQAFLKSHPELDDIFYATTPPNVLIKGLEDKGILLGNLLISRQPDIFIAPTNIMLTLQENGVVQEQQAFAQSRGNVLLIKKGNPKKIKSIEDIFRKDVVLFISNPVTEKASYQVYKETLLALCEEQGIDKKLMLKKLGTESSSILFGEMIHHREAPQAIYSNTADIAMVYYHLALRYCRIFPDDFDFIPLGGSKENPRPTQGNVRTNYHAGLITSTENKQIAREFIDFLLNDAGTAIYESHGLNSLR